MTFGSSNRVALRVVEETTWGVTPATPALQALRFTQESLNYNANFITSQEIRSDRMTPDTIRVASHASGDIKGELSYGTFDLLLGCALFSDWVSTGTPLTATDVSLTKTAGTPNTWALTTTAGNWTTKALTVGQWVKVTGFAAAGPFWAQVLAAPSATVLQIAPSKDLATEAAGASVTVTPMNYLRNGVQKRSLTVQKAFTDLAITELWNFTGVRIGKTMLELKAGSILGAHFTVMAKDATMGQTQFAGAVITPANTNTIMNAVDNVTSIVFDGDPGGNQYYFQSLALDIDNVLRGQEAVGTLGYVGVEPGSLKVMGNIELYFENETLFNKFRATTPFSLSFVVQDVAGNSYIITIPRAKFVKMEIVAGGLDKDIFAKAEIHGLINTAGTYQIQISRG